MNCKNYFFITVVATFIFVGQFAFADENVSVESGSSTPGCEATSDCFSPSSVTIEVGETIHWTNNDSAAHTVTSGSAAAGPDGNFDSSLFLTGRTFSHTFSSTGNFPYFCMVHPWMTSQITVTSSTGSGGAGIGGIFLMPVPLVSVPVISVDTDKTHYASGDQVIVTGGVVGHITDTVRLEVFDRFTTLVMVDDHLKLDSQDEFEKILTTAGLSDGTYTIKVSHGGSIASTTFAIAVSPSVSSAPLGLVATPVSTTSVNLAWSAPISDGGRAITSYKVERNLNGAGFIDIAIAGPNIPTYTDFNLSPGDQAVYRVSAINSVGTGPPSNEASIIQPQTTITVTTDKNKYLKGDTIQVHGSITNPVSGDPVTVTTRDSNGNIVAVVQVPFNTTTNTYQSIVETTGPLITPRQSIIISALHGSNATKSTTITLGPPATEFVAVLNDTIDIIAADQNDQNLMEATEDLVDLRIEIENYFPDGSKKIKLLGMIDDSIHSQIIAATPANLRIYPVQCDLSHEISAGFDYVPNPIPVLSSLTTVDPPIEMRVIDIVCIPRIIKGGDIQGATIFNATKSLQINLGNATDGRLIISLDKSLINAKNQTSGIEQPFLVTIDGGYTGILNEVNNPTVRVLTIPFQAGAQTILINGTFGKVTSSSPIITIFSPQNNAAFDVNDTVNFVANAIDPEDSDITTNIVWSSNIDGNLGTGGTLSINTLSEGTHIITASIQDSDGLSDSSTRTINVTTTPPWWIILIAIGIGVIIFILKKLGII